MRCWPNLRNRGNGLNPFLVYNLPSPLTPSLTLTLPLTKEEEITRRGE
jgi:hypothetical protein